MSRPGSQDGEEPECIEQKQSLDKSGITEIWYPLISGIRDRVLKSGGYEYGHSCRVGNGNGNRIYHYVHKDFRTKVYTCSECRTEFALDEFALDEEAVREDSDDEWGEIDIRVTAASRDFVRNNFPEVIELRLRRRQIERLSAKGKSSSEILRALLDQI